MVRIISSVTPKFKNFKTIWYNIKEGRDLDNLLARLQLEEDHITKADGTEPSAAVSRGTTYIVLIDVDSGKFVEVANDERLKIFGYDTILIYVLVEHRWELRRLEGVPYVPESIHNLCSTGATTKKGFYMKIDSIHCNLFDSQNNLVATGLKVRNNQFRMCFKQRHDEMADIAEVVTQESWHKSLGHISSGTVKNMSSQFIVKSLTQRGENIHVDFCGPMTVNGIGDSCWIWW
ncbi:hypothetical protein JTB14_003576 [Gonioctena quinquepunctata]|nr:hypothetical protein JTB14_003576 [Gonioctena quinquepunctata]